MAASKRPAQTRMRRSPPQPKSVMPLIVPAQTRTAPRRPFASVSEAPPLKIAARDPTEAQTQLEKGARGSVPQPKPRSVSQPQDSTSAKLLVIASVMSLVVVVLSIAVLSRTTGLLSILQPDAAPAKPATPPALTGERVSPAPIEKKDTVEVADLMLMLDVEPKNASLVVHRTAKGFEVEVAASGYQPERRTIERGVKGRIAVKLERAPKKIPTVVVKKKAKRKAPRKRAVAKKAPNAEVFLTGSDL